MGYVISLILPYAVVGVIGGYITKRAYLIVVLVGLFLILSASKHLFATPYLIAAVLKIGALWLGCQFGRKLNATQKVVEASEPQKK